MLTATHSTILKSHPIDSQNGVPDNFQSIPFPKASKIEYNWIKPAENNHWVIELKSPQLGRFNWYVFRDHVKIEETKSEIIADLPIVRKDQAEAIFGRKITDFQFEKLDQCLNRFEINTIPRVRHFLSQVAHESGGLRWIVELASGDAYEGRKDLGNTKPGDGKRFKGVDPLQMTGRSNYQAFANYIGDQKVMEGWRYVSSNYLFLPSGFWWQNNKMNALCDRGATVREITRRVNGGYNGLADREKYYQKALKAI